MGWTRVVLGVLVLLGAGCSAAVEQSVVMDVGSVSDDVIETNGVDDIGFSDRTVELDANRADSKATLYQDGLRRNLGVPDTSVVVGYAFAYSIPEDAFSGKISHFEAEGLPSWLRLDGTAGKFEGVPLESDLGHHYIVVRAVAADSVTKVKDNFAVEILTPSGSVAGDVGRAVLSCPDEVTLLTVRLDTNPSQMAVPQRVSLLRNMASHLGVSLAELRMVENDGDSALDNDDSVLEAGPGDAREKTASLSTDLSIKIGCGGAADPGYWRLLENVKTEAGDGTLREAASVPVIGWFLSRVDKDLKRSRREVGSGDYYDDLDDYDDYSEVESRVIPTLASPVYPDQPNTDRPDNRYDGGASRVSPVFYGTPVPTPVLVPVIPTRLESSVYVEPSRGSPEEEGEPPTDGRLESSLTEAPVAPMSTLPLPEVTPRVTSAPQPTTAVSPTATSTLPTVVPTEEIITGIRNSPPHITRRLKKTAAIAGKVLRKQIPVDMFSDLETGNTRQLRLVLKTEDGLALPKDSWIQFDPEKQEIYALPVDKTIGRYEFVLEAIDEEGASVSDTVTINVRQHSGSRNVHHRFSLHLKLDAKLDFPTAVDWQLELVEWLQQLYGDDTPERIVVHHVRDEPGHPIVFTWSNDTLPTQHCPTEELRVLLQKLMRIEDGTVSPELRSLLSPQFTVKRVSYKFSGLCDSKMKPPFVPVEPTRSSKNFAPVLRNPVDKLTVTVGELLRFQVPRDTFYDTEDGETRNMELQLLTEDRTVPPRSSWLQFDVKNQEFLGLPLQENVGETSYQLECTDSSGQTLTDSIIVEVVPRQQTQRFNVEFSLRLNSSYEQFSRDTYLKARVVEKISQVYRDPDTSHITVKSITRGSVVFAWHNNSLPYEPCPNEQILELRRALIDDDGRIDQRVIGIFSPAFHVTDAKIMPTNVCLGELTPTSAVPGAPGPGGGSYGDDEETPPTGGGDDFLITFIVPGVVIAAMLLIAGLIACCLYRARRRGKMSMNENRTFVSKGIPIIFADELDDKPDKQAKTPVILKNEQPPMPPPGYPRVEDSPSPATPMLDHDGNPNERADIEDSSASPYQPPPPFTTNRDSGRPSRPKPGPTYRKPPPYVPP